jgi:hypothetical protein
VAFYLPEATDSVVLESMTQQALRDLSLSTLSTTETKRQT